MIIEVTALIFDQLFRHKRGRRADSEILVLMADPAADPVPHPGLACAASDLLAEMARWLAHLRGERRLSPKTREAYDRDVRQFLIFLGSHWGKTVTLKRFAALEAADVRAFMAARRGDDIAGRSLMRTLAGLRSFARYLEREGKGKVGALAAIAPRESARACRSRCRWTPHGNSSTPTCAPARTGRPGCWPRRRGAGAALWLRPAHFRGSRVEAARRRPVRLQRGLRGFFGRRGTEPRAGFAPASRCACRCSCWRCWPSPAA